MAEKTILTKNGEINDFAMIDALKGWNKTLSNIEHQQEKKDLGEVENKLETQSVGEQFVEQAKKDTDKEMAKSQAVFNYDRYDNWEDKTANDARQLLKMQWEKKDEYPVWANDDNELYVGKNAPEGYKPIAEVYTDAEELSNAEKKAREQFKQELITTAEAEAFLNTDADRSKMIELFNQNYNHRDYRSKLINLYNDRQNEIIQNSIQKEIEDIDKRIKEEDKKHPLQASQFSFVGAGKFGATPTIQFTEEQRNLNATADILKDIKKDVDARINKRGFFKGVGDELFTVDALDLGITSLLNNTQVATTLGQMEEKGFDNLREDEKVLLDALIAKEMVNLLPPSSLAYNIGSGVGFSIPFMIGYGLSKIPASALSKGTGKLISKYITKRVEQKGLGGAIARASQAVATKAPRLTKLGNAVGQGTIQAGVQTVISPHTYSDMAERQIGEIETEQQITPEGVTAEFVGRNVDDKAVSKALLSSFITNTVEGMGGKALGEVGGYVFNKVMPGVKNLFPKLKKAFVTHGINQLAKSTDFNGMLNEFGEEYIDQTLNALFVGDQTLEDVYSGENAIETALTTAAISFGLGLLGGGVGYAAQTHAKKKYNDAVKRLDTAMPNLQAKQELVNQIVTQDHNERKILFANLQDEIIKLRKEGKGQEAYALLEQAEALSKFASAYDNLSIFNEYLNDQVQERMKTERDHIRQNANADMDNHTMIAQYEGENYLVVGGKVAFNQDGTIDLANSSESVTIKSPDGEKQIISPEKLSLVADMSFEELEAQAEQMVWQRINNEMTEAELEVNRKEQAPSAQGADGMLRIPITFEQAVELNSQGYKTEANGQEVSVVVAPQQEATVRQAIAELGGEGVNDNTQAPAEAITQEEATEQTEVPQTAVSKIPQDDKGNFLYEQTDSETAFDAIVEQSNGDAKKAQRMIESMLQDKKDELKKAEKSKPRKGTTILDKIAAEDEHQAKIEKIKQEVSKWEEIASVSSKRNAEVKTEEVAPKVEVEQEPQYKLSDEVDEDGLPFVVSPSGTTEFGEIKSETGLTPAPIKLSLGNSKYGLVHLEKRHGDQIRNAGFKSVEEFVEYVCKNYKRIKQGENSTGEDNGTYLLQIEDAHNNTLYVELSTDGSYWGVNSGGVFRKGYGSNKKEVWSAPEVQNKQSATDSTLREEEKSDNPTTPNGNVPTTSTAKGTELVSNKQENKKENKLPIQKRQITYFAKEDKELGEYFSFRDFVLRKIATGQMSFIWGNSKSGTKGLASHLGLSSSNKERLKRIWMLDNTNGLYPEVAAEALLQEYAETFGEREGLPEDITGMTSMDAFNELMDVLSSYDTRNSMMKAAQEIHNSGEAEHIANLEVEGETETSSFDETDTPQGVGNPLGEERDEVPFRQGEQDQTSKAESQGKTPYILSEEYQKELKATATRRRKELKEVSKVFAEELKNNPDIVIVQSVDDLPKEATSTMTAKELQNAIAAKGWFVAKNGKAYILFENAKDKEDLYATLFHEAVAHKGIKELLGTVNFNKLCQAVYDAMPEADRERIRAREEYARAKRDKDGNIIEMGSVSQALIADEYMAELAEEISKSKGKTTIAEDIVQAIRAFLRKIGIKLNINQNDVRHILHASYSKLQGKDADIMNTALGKKIKQTAVREKIDDAVRNRLVYHGSGAEFERFDHDYMGTGEGAQAFGWGTYVTDVEGIGRTYATAMRDKLISKKHNENAIINKLAKDTLEIHTKEEALNFLRSLLNEDWSDKKRVKAQIKIIETGKFLPETKAKAHLYNVDIPDDNGTNYIHWGTNTQELADKLNDAYRTMLIKEKGVKEEDINPDFAPFGKGVSGGTIYKLFARELGGDKQASQFLSSLGFVGISYPAQSTTGGRADGARNFVIFNEDDAQIVEHTRFRLTQEEQDIISQAKANGATHYIVTNPSDIKSATENVGTYDSNNPDIRFRLSEETEKIFSLAKDKFGTTYDMREAGYILPDGDMLNFSYQGGYRDMDHREISGINYDEEDNETGIDTDMGDFLDRGAIRIDYEAGAINLNVQPTTEQKNRLKRLIEHNGGDVYVDFGKGWDTEHYAEYESARASRVLGDIDRYYEGGIKPEGNIRFRFIGEQGANFSLDDTRLRKLEEGETCKVERIFTENKSFDFTSGEKIETYEDVAFIFKQLQDESIENTFAVLVKDGKPTVIHLGMGSYTQSMVNGSALNVAVERVQPDKIYFVHNHPSGQLRASQQDKNILDNLKGIYGEDVVADGIIINLRSGKFGTFGHYDSIIYNEKDVETPVPIKVYSFNKQVFDKDYNPSELFQALDSVSIAGFISSQRLGDRPKLGLLVCNNQLQIVGNIFTKYTEISKENAKEIANDIVYYTTTMGGTNAVLFGDGFFKDINNKRISDIVKGISLGHIALTDYINVNKEGYLSAYDEGVRFSLGNIEEVNKRFNEELQQQIDGTLTKGHIYQLGMPSETLRSTNIANVPIQLKSDKLYEKATQFGHDFELVEIKDLVKSINDPIAIFSYGNKEKAQNIVIEIQHEDKNFIVGISIKPTIGGKVLEVNSIRNIFPKDNAEWLNWISQDKSLYLNKEKIQALIDKQRTNLADVEYLDLNSVTKLIKDFENPTFEAEKNTTGVNFRLSEEADATISIIEQRNSEAYNSVMNVELPKDETPMEIAKNKQAERTLFRFDKDFASMQALQEAMRKTELWKYNQEGKAGELNRGLYDSMVQLANLIKTIEKAYGIKIDDDSNAYWLENSSSSKAQERTEQLSQTLVRSLSLAMHEAEKKLGSQELLKHYALAKAGLERQAIKEAEARAIAQEKGEEYEDKDYAGLTGLLADMMGMTEKGYEELSGKPMQEVFAIAKQNGIELDKFIADCEAKLGNTASKLWSIVTELSDNQLKGQLEAGLISANTFNLLMYSGDANTLIEENVKNGLISKGQAKYIKTQGFTLEQLRDKGYITEEQYKNFVKGKKRYQYYLPLKGDSSLQAEDVIKYEHTRGKNQSKMKEAKGHRYKSTDPFVQLVSDCYGAIANEELNRWKRAIYEMCEKYPTDDFILDGQLMVQQLDGTLRPATDYEIQNGQFKVVKNRQKADIAQTPLQSKEHIMYVYINGEYRTIYFKNKQLAESINTQGGKFGKMQWLLEKTADFQRWWSKNLTTRNPAFIGANTARDFEEAMFVNFVNLGAKAIPVFAKAWNPASKLQRALHRHLKGKGGNTPEDQLVQEYFANGGVTAYNMIADNVKIKNDLQAMIDDANRGILNPAKWWKATMSWLDRQSKHAELVSRIATYAMYRGTIADYSVGLNESVTRSIWESKEVTVNFDKRGEWSKYTNLTSLFFNAGRQSNRMHYELFKRHPYRYLAAKTMMIAVKAMLPSLSAWLTSLFFDDEDYEKLIEKYNKINRYTRYNNLVLLLGDNVIAIPIAPSFSTTSMMAELARGLSDKNMEWDKWIPDAINAALSTYTTSAIGNIGSSLYEGDIQGAMLSAIPVAAIEPALQLMTNRDYQGRAIMKDGDWVEGLPNYKRAYGNTNPYLLEFSRWLNNVLGGKDNIPGALNSLNNPAGIQHLFTSYGGGALTFYTDLASLAMMLTTREDATASDYLRQAPIINRFFKGNIDRYMEQDAMESFYTAKENLQILNNRKRALPEWQRAEYEQVVTPLVDRFKQYDGQVEAAKSIRDIGIDNLGEGKTFAKEKQLKDNYRKEFVNIMQDFDDLEKEIDEATKKY